jgi:hypothetical protein
VTSSGCRASRRSSYGQSHADSWSLMSDYDDVAEQTVGGANVDEPFSSVSIAASAAAHPRRSPRSFGGSATMTIQLLKCGHCDTNNSVATCPKCARPFVVVSRHLSGGVREFDDPPLESGSSSVPDVECDFCAEKRAGRLAEAVSAGLRQRTCASCHTEFLSQHDL